MGQVSKFHTRKATIGEKITSGVQAAAEVAGTAKTIYDIGKGIYSVGRVAAPILAGLI